MTVAARIVVIGVGNEFRHDDGVGWAVIERLRGRGAEHRLPSGTVLETCDGDPGRLLGLWEGAELAVVVDAARNEPSRPGRVHRLVLDGTGQAPAGATSSHGLGLGEAVELSSVLGRLPGRLVVYAVEGADATFGTGLSSEVEAQVGVLVQEVENEIERHGADTAPARPRDAS
ncbi:hydrogenase maturation protease [Streptomyces sp. NPDC020707]|jgi:hydrogenase maturation protease|uniref:Hydrogenase maturation protease n=1 Tax=Streptomyces ortus TaxID=2867268 RepID=A0ABT3UWF5_9ACTN|nr:hydrogenase maturation protease [Streptomyces ortus]MCX4231896.1 hydrogenase maturation protease [Streptomyces ortus]